MNILSGLEEAMACIEADLCRPDIAAAARCAGMTADSFARFFSYICGVTLPVYIRRRRLTQAAYALRGGQTSVLAVALQYGYSSADAFARAFMRQHGVTPSQARDPACPLRAWPPVSFHIAVTGTEAVTWRLLETPAIPLRGLCWPLAAAAGERFDAEGELWQDMRNMRRINPEIEGMWYGIRENGTYCMAKPAAEAIPDGTQPFAIAAGTYAVFFGGGGGNAAELIRLHRLAFGHWLPEAGYRQTRDCEIEVMHLYEKPRKSQRRYELWIPVEKCHADK